MAGISDHIFREIMLKRIHIRQRALRYTEHMAFWQTKISGGNVAIQSEDQWKEEVSRIEGHLLREEAPEMSQITLNLWEPEGICFDEIRVGVEVEDTISL